MLFGAIALVLCLSCMCVFSLEQMTGFCDLLALVPDHWQYNCNGIALGYFFGCLRGA